MSGERYAAACAPPRLGGRWQAQEVRGVAVRFDRTPAALIRAAGGGDEAAWAELVSRYSGMVWAVARGHRLGPADAADVVQTVWLRLVEHLDRLHDPEHVGGWLATTTRHECLRVIRRAGRELPDEDIEASADSLAAPEPSPESVVLADERKVLLWQALERLPERCRTLLRALAMAPDGGYAEISAALGMPIGSIGPTRARCLDRLRAQIEVSGALLDTGDS